MTLTAELGGTANGQQCLDLLLSDPARALVALDFDGTLSPIVDVPAQAVADQAAVSALGRIGARIGQVAVITGRPARVAVELGGLDRIPGLSRMVVLGQYGVERWDAASGRFDVPEPPPGIAAVEERLPSLLAELDLADVHVEHKSRALGVHTRQTGDPVAALARLREPLQQLAAEHGLGVEPGRNVLEIRAASTDKGDALRELVAAGGARSVVFGGDDLGDLPAFRAARSLGADGVASLLLCSGSAEETALQELADVTVAGPPGVAAWLAGLADLLEQDPR